MFLLARASKELALVVVVSPYPWLRRETLKPVLDPVLSILLFFFWYDSIIYSEPQVRSHVVGSMLKPDLDPSLAKQIWISRPWF